MSGQEPEPRMTLEVRLILAVLITARVTITCLVRLRRLCHRAWCKECRHGR
jgi:hypothetical protein